MVDVGDDISLSKEQNVSISTTIDELDGKLLNAGQKLEKFYQTIYETKSEVESLRKKFFHFLTFRKIKEKENAIVEMEKQFKLLKKSILKIISEKSKFAFTGEKTGLLAGFLSKIAKLGTRRKYAGLLHMFIIGQFSSSPAYFPQNSRAFC